VPLPRRPSHHRFKDLTASPLPSWTVTKTPTTSKRTPSVPPTAPLSGPSLKTTSTPYSTPPLHKPPHSSTHFDINSQNTSAPPSTTLALTPYTNKQFSTAHTPHSTTSHSHHHRSSSTQTTASLTTHLPFPRPQPTLYTQSSHSISASSTLAHPYPPDLPPHHPLHHKVDSVSTPYVAGAKPESLHRGPSAADKSTASAVNTEDSSHLNQRKHTSVFNNALNYYTPPLTRRSHPRTHSLPGMAAGPIQQSTT
jgi:hypothetical protein